MIINDLIHYDLNILMALNFITMLNNYEWLSAITCTYGYCYRYETLNFFEYPRKHQTPKTPKSCKSASLGLYRKFCLATN